VKSCKECLIVKPLSDFFKDRTQVDGFMRRCKLCDKARKQSIEYKEYAREYGYAWRELHPDYQAQWMAENPGYMEEWFATHPDKAKEYHDRFRNKK
jgi:hypothetical protein